MEWAYEFCSFILNKERPINKQNKNYGKLHRLLLVIISDLYYCLFSFLFFIFFHLFSKIILLGKRYSSLMTDFSPEKKCILFHQ